MKSRNLHAFERAGRFRRILENKALEENGKEQVLQGKIAKEICKLCRTHSQKKDNTNMAHL